MIRRMACVLVLCLGSCAQTNPAPAGWKFITPPRSGDLLRVSAGQSYQRLALRATTLGIAQQLIHAPISVERFRGDLLRAFGAPGEDPIAFLRLGHARSPEPSVRRSVAMVASFRNS